MKYLFILFISSPAFAVESEWLCESASIQKQGNTYFSCGVFQYETEGFARIHAMKAAMNEFYVVCGASTGCMQKPRTVVPGRMSCKPFMGIYKCWQYLEITVGG